MATLGTPRRILDLEQYLALPRHEQRLCTREWPLSSSRRSQRSIERMKLPVSSRLADKMWDLLLTAAYEDDDDDKEYAYL